MSPEQVRGEGNLGPQSDQFSLGLVLYELAAGRRAFERTSSAETMAAIIRDDPDPLPATVPTALRWVIERCSRKIRRTAKTRRATLQIWPSDIWMLEGFNRH